MSPPPMRINTSSAPPSIHQSLSPSPRAGALILVNLPDFPKKTTGHWTLPRKIYKPVWY